MRTLCDTLVEWEADIWLFRVVVVIVDIGVMKVRVVVGILETTVNLLEDVS